MSIDTSNLPVSPALAVALAGYTAFSVLISGQEIGKREIDKSNWSLICESDLRASLQSKRRPPDVVPEVPNLGDMICTFYPELHQYCHMIPDPVAAAREAARRANAAEEARIRNAAAGLSDRCSCAEAVYLEEERIALGLYAATARAYTPNAVETRNAALKRAVNAPTCTFGMGG